MRRLSWLLAFSVSAHADPSTWVLYTNSPGEANGMAAREEVATITADGETPRLRCLRLARMLEDLDSGSECMRALRIAQDARRPLYWCEPR